MKVTIETTDDPTVIVELLREVHEEHRQRRPDWFKPLIDLPDERQYDRQHGWERTDTTEQMAVGEFP